MILFNIQVLKRYQLEPIAILTFLKRLFFCRRIAGKQDEKEKKKENGSNT
jgi:hypothetical protein